MLVHVGASVAAFKAGSVVTELRRQGATVRVALSREAGRFVTPLTLQALSGHPVATDLWPRRRARARPGGALDGAPAGAGPALEAAAPDHAMPHLELARWCDLQVVVAASADLLARLAHGLADDLVTVTALACRAPLLVAPAMETAMWENPATVANTALLRARGVVLIGPLAGRQASGDWGAGRMAEPEAIAAAALELAEGMPGPAPPLWLAGHGVVVTAGGTREPIDPVRHLGNRSSGRMGNALAAEALAQGARVTLITAAPPPPPSQGLVVVEVETAAEMGREVWRALAQADVLVMAAAVADWRPARPSATKLPKRQLPSRLELEPTEDILAGLRDHPRRLELTVVGFAAETDELVARAQDKLRTKGLDLIVANEVGREGIGIGAEDNAVTILGPEGVIMALTRRSKTEVARAILAALRSRMGGPETVPGG